MNAIAPERIRLVLEKGFQAEGLGWGDFSETRGGEFVFCTAMSGIEESLTDPSFARQVLVSTSSHVGNTGFTGIDMESDRIWAEGLICRHLEKTPSNWRAKDSLGNWIVREKRFVVEGIDTRALTLNLRDNGSQRGIVIREGRAREIDLQQEIARVVPSMEGLDLTGLVSCAKPYPFADQIMQDYWPLKSRLGLNPSSNKEPTGDLGRIAVWDFGVKKNTLRILKAIGFEVVVLPSSAKAEEVLEAGQAGILLSNGPGDPAAATHVIAELKKVLGRRRVFAICLGHQLVAHAVGAKTFKMKFGHRGIHHPVVQLSESGAPIRTWITSQNHGFAVDPDSLPKGVRASFVHADDLSVEGLDLPNHNCSTVQFHPEAGPGPIDSVGLIVESLVNSNQGRLS